MHPSDEAILRFEKRLRQEVRRFGEGLRRHLTPDTAAAGANPYSIEAWKALAAEDARLRRRARSGDPGYDLNRHIAVRRLMALRAVPAMPF
ncbi:hypothetical protein [Aureimonas sp. SK2]|uniref:hypothetical protein n=1 Tax=Aureimonas sp. SK2 TaxID=3015992 RepID=UPI002443B6EA|nr:hypothetical protein [Aureimonas sp. SK2]